jgi:hypothetical protein
MGFQRSFTLDCTQLAQAIDLLIQLVPMLDGLGTSFPTPSEYAPHVLAVVLLVEDGAPAGALAHCLFSAHLPLFSLLQEMQS